jgi:hypothetical protein
MIILGMCLFVFGQASLGERVGVCPTALFGDVKLWWGYQLKPKESAENLASFAKTHDLKAEVTAWQTFHPPYLRLSRIASIKKPRYPEDSAVMIICETITSSQAW